MIEEKLNAIRKLLHENYPDLTIYVDDMTQGFKRPSFYVNSPRSPLEQVASNLFEEDTTFQVMYFAEKNASGNVSKLELYKKRDEIINVFVGPSRIGDYKISKFNSEIINGEIHFDFNIISHSSREEERYSDITGIEIDIT